ncbi:hypothetical protein CLAVI_000492 [Candidatus Clavichlamydia salmonicola]|nr:hypothetical protein [Candidatus Clavichlamydia salmonicola]
MVEVVIELVFSFVYSVGGQRLRKKSHGSRNGDSIFFEENKGLRLRSLQHFFYKRRII